MNSCRWFHLYDILDKRAQLDGRHVSHLAFDGSDRMVGETVVGPPIPSLPFSPFLGSFNKFTWYKNKALYTRIAAYSDQTRPNPTFVSTYLKNSKGVAGSFDCSVVKWEDLMDNEEAIETLPEVYGDDFAEFNLLVGMADEKKTKGFANNETTSIICLSTSRRGGVEKWGGRIWDLGLVLLNGKDKIILSDIRANIDLLILQCSGTQKECIHQDLLALSAFNLGEISAISRRDLGDIGRDFAEILISDLGCSKVTTYITKRVLASMQEKEKITKKKKRNIEILRSENTIDLSEDEDVDDEIDHGKTKQSTLDINNPIKQNLKMVAWKKIATWAYTVGLPFNAVRDESFQDMIYAIGEYGRGMSAPSYHNLRVTLLKDALEDTKKFSIDASEHVKDAQLIVKMINEVIEDVGEENILQFITDNGSNVKAAGAILEEQHPKLFWTPCVAHCVNLVIGDIGEKIPKTKSALSDARAVVVYIYNHTRILNMMRKLTKNKELHRSCVTRFATQFYTLKNVHENQHHLQALFVSEQWTKSDFAKKAVGKRVERIVAKQEF
ncbi:hypothetical protein Tco_0661876 [Tanacetum coccineum]